MREFTREMFLVLGFASLVAGIALIYIPAAFIIGGGALVWVCYPSQEKAKQEAKNKQGGK